MKTITATVLLSCCSCCAFAQDKRAISAAEAGCGPQDAKFEVKTDESQHPTATPEDGKALIYVVADGHLTTLFGFDEKWVGAVHGGIKGDPLQICPFLFNDFHDAPPATLLLSTFCIFARGCRPLRPPVCSCWPESNAPRSLSGLPQFLQSPSKLSGVQSTPSRYNRTMPVRLIALDIDGTLLDSRWQVSEANRRAIAEAARRGIEVALVTGRRYDFATPVARQLDAPLTMIVNNGALIRSNDGRTHLRHLLPLRVAEQVLRLTKPWREGAAVIFDRPAEDQLMLERLDPDDSLRYAYYSRNKQFIGLANPLETCLTEDPIQVMLSGKVAPMRQAEQALRDAPFAKEFALAVTMYEHRDFAMIDVLNPTCSKGASLAEWATLRGLAREEVMAIGDNHNDLEMLTFAGIPVVMGNSVPELKTYGWHETRTNDENGVAHAIEQFALREAAPCA